MSAKVWKHKNIVLVLRFFSYFKSFKNILNKFFEEQQNEFLFNPKNGLFYVR